MRACKVADIAKELGLTTDQFALCLGFGWSPDAIRVKFGPEESTIVDLSETIGAMSINEVLALMLAFGQQKFVSGPMMKFAELIAECSIERLFSYLVMAKGDMKGLLALAEILKRKVAQGYPEQLEAMKLSLWHWFYCALVYSSGVFVGIDSIQPLYDGKQLTSEVAGFLTPNQLADFTLSEVEDLIPVLAPVGTPIYGAIGILRYPTKPLRLAPETPSTSFLTFLRNKRPHDYQQMLERWLFMIVPGMYTTIKAEIQQEENLMGILLTRTKKACSLPREYGPVNWYASPLDFSGMPVRYN